MPTINLNIEDSVPLNDYSYSTRVYERVGFVLDENQDLFIFNTDGQVVNNFENTDTCERIKTSVETNFIPVAESNNKALVLGANVRCVNKDTVLKLTEKVDDNTSAFSGYVIPDSGDDKMRIKKIRTKHRANNVSYIIGETYNNRDHDIEIGGIDVETK